VAADGVGDGCSSATKWISISVSNVHGALPQTALANLTFLDNHLQQLVSIDYFQIARFQNNSR